VSVFISCLLVIVFGERSRSAASDLRPLLVDCLGRRLPNCGVRVPELTDATQWVMLLGIPVVTATALGLLAAVATLSAERRVAVERAPTLLLATLVAGAGAYFTADGVAGWLAYAYLADIARGRRPRPDTADPGHFVHGGRPGRARGRPHPHGGRHAAAAAHRLKTRGRPLLAGAPPRTACAVMSTQPVSPRAFIYILPPEDDDGVRWWTITIARAV
jgi:hypothetical protein